MRVLVVHNHYRSRLPSGENVVVLDESSRLRDAGVEIIEFFSHSDSIATMSPFGRLVLATGPVFNREGIRRFQEVLSEAKPDIVHIHNVFPLISPHVVSIAKNRGIPVVHTVHNYRHTCVSGLHSRDGAVCTLCAGRRLALPAIQHGCYRDSRLQSTMMAAGQFIHRDTWRRVDAMLVAHDFLAQTLIESGAVDEERIVIFPNSAPSVDAIVPPGDALLYVGRLEEAKGVDILLDAWRNVGPQTRKTLRLVGDGPMRNAVSAAAEADGTIDFRGHMPHEALAEEYRKAAVIAVPSRAFEGQPRALVEGMSHGRPAIVPDYGGVAASVTEDFAWKCPNTVQGWCAIIPKVLGDREAIEAKSARARQRYLDYHEPSLNTARLIGIYEGILAGRR